MAPAWLTCLAWLSLSVCFCCAGVIGYDIAVNRRRQPMAVMNVVFPVTALYFGPLAVAFYWRWARAPAAVTGRPMAMSRTAVPQRASAAAALDGMHLPAGLDTHHDLVGGAGPDTPSERVRPWWGTMAIEVSHCGSGCSLGDVISEFAVFALTAFEIGLFGWMAVMAFVLFPAPHRLVPSSAAFWLLMQVGMMIGYGTSWPANVWLVRRGIKVPT